MRKIEGFLKKFMGSLAFGGKLKILGNFGEIEVLTYIILNYKHKRRESKNNRKERKRNQYSVRTFVTTI